MMKFILTSLFLLLSLTISACRSRTAPATIAQAPSLIPEKYVVTGQADGAPQGCSPHEIAQRADSMFDAITRGDPNVIDEYFGKKRDAPFQWYSMTVSDPNDTDQNHFVAYNLDELSEYLGQRYEQHEQVALQSVQFNGWEEARGVVHFGPIIITRRADDLKPGLGGPEDLALGKGAYHCETQAFIVLSFGMGIK